MTQQKDKIILGVAGEFLSGKSSAADFYISKYDAKLYKFSRIMDQVLTTLNLPINRKNEQDIAVIMKELYGGTVWANALAINAERTGHPFVLFDGLRKEDEVVALKAKLPHFCLIYIDAPIEVRYERAKTRLEKPGENLLTLEEFKLSQLHAADIDIPRLRDHADHIILNTGSIEDFHSQLAAIVSGELMR